MDPESRRFGRGPRELTGAVDLISHYRLQAHHDFFCKKSLPVSVSDTHYLHNVVGEVEIRRGEGMELDQLLQNPPYSRETTLHIQPFDLDTLREAFQLRETSPVELSSVDKGLPTVANKTKDSSKDKDKKHKKHKDKDGKKDKDKEHKKHKHRHRERSKDKDNDQDKSKDKKDKNTHHDPSGSHSKKHHDKKRKHEGSEDTDSNKHKKSKHKSSSMDEVGMVKVAG